MITTIFEFKKQYVIVMLFYTVLFEEKNLDFLFFFQ
jgi:hypothetical protein